MSLEIITPPSRRNGSIDNVSVFLAGSIDMGAARDWQSDLISRFHGEDYSFFNPRRPGAFTGEQSLKNESFVEQVNWEIDNIQSSDIVVMFITAESKAPISLLEFGLCLGDPDIKNIAVAVEPGFYRRGNIEVMCNRFAVALYEDLTDLEQHIRRAAVAVQRDWI